MFSKAQLELIEDILEQCPPSNITEADLRDLRGAVHSALWNLAREIPRKDKAAIEAARAAGITQIVGRNTEPSQKPTVRVASRMRPIRAKSADDLLEQLGL